MKGGNSNGYSFLSYSQSLQRPCMGGTTHFADEDTEAQQGKVFSSVSVIRWQNHDKKLCPTQSLLILYQVAFLYREK